MQHNKGRISIRLGASVLKDLFLSSGQGWDFSSMLIKPALKVLYRATGQERDRKGFQHEKKKLKMSLLLGDEINKKS